MHALLLIATLCADPDIEAMKRSLESQIGLYQQVNDHEKRLKDLEKLIRENPEPTVVEDRGEPQAPTSHEAIQFALSMYRGIRPEHTFVDIGCGDGRVLIAAVQKWKCNGLGVEIDVEQAALARRCVEAAGLSHKIRIVEGDATSPDVMAEIKRADAGFAFLYPETLDALTDVIASIPAFVSYQHPVSGLKETRSETGKFYSKEPVAQAETRVVATAPYADWGGRRYYSEYNPGCNCAMCQSIRGQLRIPRTTTVSVQPTQQASAVPQVNVSPQRTGRMVKQCINGVCQWVWVWDQ